MSLDGCILVDQVHNSACKVRIEVSRTLASGQFRNLGDVFRVTVTEALMRGNSDPPASAACPTVRWKNSVCQAVNFSVRPSKILVLSLTPHHAKHTFSLLHKTMKSGIFDREGL